MLIPRRPTTRLPAHARLRPQQGSVLIESMVAVVIFSMGVLSLVGLQSNMLKLSSDNRYRAQAQAIAQSHLAQLMTYGSRATSYISQLDKSRIKQQLPNGSISFSAITNQMVTVTVSWQQPGSTVHQVNASGYLFEVVP